MICYLVRCVNVYKNSLLVGLLVDLTIDSLYNGYNQLISKSGIPDIIKESIKLILFVK